MRFCSSVMRATKESNLVLWEPAVVGGWGLWWGAVAGGAGREKTSSAKSEEASPGKRQWGGDWEHEKSSPDKGEAGKEQHSWQRDCTCKGPVAEGSVADTRESTGWGGRRSECGTGPGEGVSRGLTRLGLARHAKAMGTVGLHH